MTHKTNKQTQICSRTYSALCLLFCFFFAVNTSWQGRVKFYCLHTFVFPRPRESNQPQLVVKFMGSTQETMLCCEPYSICQAEVCRSNQLCNQVEYCDSALDSISTAEKSCHLMNRTSYLIRLVDFHPSMNSLWLSGTQTKSVFCNIYPPVRSLPPIRLTLISLRDFPSPLPFLAPYIWEWYSAVEGKAIRVGFKSFCKVCIAGRSPSCCFFSTCCLNYHWPRFRCG